jgi:hypothetical protein
MKKLFLFCLLTAAAKVKAMEPLSHTTIFDAYGPAAFERIKNACNQRVERCCFLSCLIDSSWNIIRAHVVNCTNITILKQSFIQQAPHYKDEGTRSPYYRGEALCLLIDITRKKMQKEQAPPSSYTLLNSKLEALGNIHYDSIKHDLKNIKKQGRLLNHSDEKLRILLNIPKEFNDCVLVYQYLYELIDSETQKRM